MTERRLTDGLGKLLSLVDGTRRKLYEYVARQPKPVNRDQIAGAAGVSRSLASYHLDHLVDDGLLVASFERANGRSGPGAGRPAKFYARSPESVEVSLPRKDYALLAGVLAEALDSPDASSQDDAVQAAAFRQGVELCERCDTADVTDKREALESLLEEQGYEPYLDDDGCTRLRNCLFEREVPGHRDLICGLNLAIVRGILHALNADESLAHLDPAENRCCVAIAPHRPTTA